jgi:hypothetical protein
MRPPAVHASGNDNISHSPGGGGGSNNAARGTTPNGGGSGGGGQVQLGAFRPPLPAFRRDWDVFASLSPEDRALVARALKLADPDVAREPRLSNALRGYDHAAQHSLVAAASLLRGARGRRPAWEYHPPPRIARVRDAAALPPAACFNAKARRRGRALPKGCA